MCNKEAPRAIFLCNDPDTLQSVYSSAVIEKIAELARLDDKIYTCEDTAAGDFADVKYIFSTWGMPSMTEEEIKARFPALEAVFYAAGSVQGFAQAFLRSGVRVFSAWAANAVPVAEFVTAQIILANKGFFTAAPACKDDYDAARKHCRAMPGNYGASVGLIGCGMIGGMVARRLRGYDLTVYACDPYMSDARAEALGIRRAGLEEIFARCDVISNHLANNEATVGMLDYRLFDMMKPRGVFINTGRGAQVVESGLCRALREQPGRAALLDVTEPEPPERHSELLALGNVILTPHIAGSMGSEKMRMAEYMHNECAALLKGEAPQYEVTLEMLETMA